MIRGNGKDYDLEEIFLYVCFQEVSAENWHTLKISNVIVLFHFLLNHEIVEKNKERN